MPSLHPRTFVENRLRLDEAVKIAFLCEIPFDRLIAFRQAIEDSVNSANGKLIFVLKSNYRIRLQESVPSGEDDKYPPPYTGVTPSRVVKDAERDANRRLGFNDHPCRGSSCGPCGNIPQCDSASECLQECDRRQRDGRCISHLASNLDRCSRSPGVRLRFLAEDSSLGWWALDDQSPWNTDGLGGSMAQPLFNEMIQ
jgi:hypothetical protein